MPAASPAPSPATSATRCRDSSVSWPRGAGSCASCRASSSRTSTSCIRASGVLLNVTPDHLDRHGTLEAYAEAKLRMFARQDAGDVAVLDDDDPWIAGLSDADLPGAAPTRPHPPRGCAGGPARRLPRLGARRLAQPRERPLRCGRRRGGRRRPRRRARGRPQLPSARPPHGAGRRARRRHLRQRLEGHEPGGGDPRAQRLHPRGPPDPRRIAQGRRLRARSRGRSRTARSRPAT